MENNIFRFNMHRDNDISPIVLKSFRHPVVFGSFSLDFHRKFIHDKSGLGFLKASEEKLPFDLNQAMSKAVRKNEEETKLERLDRLLDWILLNQHKFLNKMSQKGKVESLSTDFVCFRGLLTELMCAPYEFREGLIIHATRFRGSIYLLNVETPEKEERRLGASDSDRKMCSWGYKFEQYMTGGDPDQGVDENEEYCCVLRSRLESHSLLYGAEVDAADRLLYKEPHSSLDAFVEFKTCRQLQNERLRKAFYRYRLRKWWAQSFLVGIPRVICGFRDDDGIVRSLQTLKVDEIPQTAEYYWRKELMLEFLDEFLTWVKGVVVEDDPAVVYEITRRPSEHYVVCARLPRGSCCPILPPSYVKQIFNG